MRPGSTLRTALWGAFAVIAILTPFLWLASWRHEHPITSWIAVAILVVVGLLTVCGESRRR
jgi:hypothetical protein